jgi:membrane protease subunit (stomatin/prohibitin family)
MSRDNEQGLFSRGIYEFEDPSGTLIAARMPQSGSAELYDGTAVIVKPNQCALFVYKGQIAEVLGAGTHFVRTENLPVLTKLAQWRFGMKSPLRSEIWFFSGNVFTGRRWGTPQPAVVPVDGLGSIPLRAFGNYNLVIRDPRRVLHSLVGSRSSLDIGDIENFVQGQLVELLPKSLGQGKSLEELSARQDSISKLLESLLNEELGEFGVEVQKVQILSILPPKEVIEALDSRAAMQIIGNPQEYLLYKAANSLDALRGSNSNDPLQLMMGLMLSKGMVGSDFRQKEDQRRLQNSDRKCAGCSNELLSGHQFCSRCGRKV